MDSWKIKSRSILVRIWLAVGITALLCVALIAAAQVIRKAHSDRRVALATKAFREYERLMDEYEYEKALVSLDRHIELSDDLPFSELDQKTAMRADLQLWMYRYGEAESTCRTFIEAYPDARVVRLKLAEILMTIRDFTEALGELDDLLEQDNTHVEAWKRKALCIEENGGTAEDIVHILTEQINLMDNYPSQRHAGSGLYAERASWRFRIHDYAGVLDDIYAAGNGQSYPVSEEFEQKFLHTIVTLEAAGQLPDHPRLQDILSKAHYYLPPPSYSVAVENNGHSFIVSLPTTGNGDLYRVSRDGKLLKQLTSHKLADTNPVVLPNTNSVFFHRLYFGHMKQDILRLDLKTGNTDALLSDGCFYSIEDMTRDGEWLIYTRSCPFVRICHVLMNMETRATEDLHEHARFAEDVNKLVYQKGTLANPQGTFVRDLSSGKEHKIGPTLWWVIPGPKLRRIFIMEKHVSDYAAVHAVFNGQIGDVVCRFPTETGANYFFSPDGNFYIQHPNGDLEVLASARKDLATVSPWPEPEFGAEFFPVSRDTLLLHREAPEHGGIFFVSLEDDQFRTVLPPLPFEFTDE